MHSVAGFWSGIGLQCSDGCDKLNESFQFLIRHGYTVLAVWVFAEQVGLPIPAVPVLLAVGALVGQHQMSLPAAMAVAVGASLIADTIWYELGRIRGGRVLNFLCRISLEPDSCVRKTENLFVNQGARSLLVAKFVPGLSTVAPPLAGIFGMRRWRFILFDGVGALLSAKGWVIVGLAFSNQLELVAARSASLGGWAVVILGGALAAYILWKYIQRRKFLHELRVARITPEQLKERVDRGEDIVIVDLRHSIDFDSVPMTIPGALRMAPEAIEQGHEQIPRDREVVLFCT